MQHTSRHLLATLFSLFLWNGCANQGGGSAVEATSTLPADTVSFIESNLDPLVGQSLADLESDFGSNYMVIVDGAVYYYYRVPVDESARHCLFQAHLTCPFYWPGQPYVAVAVEVDTVNQLVVRYSIDP